MWSITIKLMSKNVKMLVPAGIAIVVGTAFIAATFLFGNGLNDAMARQLTNQFAQANYAIGVKDQVNNSDAGAHVLKKMPLDRIETIDGVRAIRPDISNQIQASKGKEHYSIQAILSSHSSRMLPVRLVEGRQPDPDAKGEVALPKPVAQRIGVKVGDTVKLDEPSEQFSSSATARLVGLTDDPDKVYEAYGGAGLVSLDVFGVVFSDLGGTDEIPVNTVYLDLGPAKVDAASEQINRVIPQGYDLMSRQEASDVNMKSMSRNGTNVITTFLLTFGILALLVAGLVIANTFQVLVAQRRRTFALLRTIGARKAQLYQSVLMEAFSLGLVSSLLGVGAGIGLMALVFKNQLLDGIGVRAQLVLTWPVLLMPLAFGLVMTLLASMGSARLATKVSPLEALRPLEVTDQRKSSLVRGILGSIMILLGLVLAFLAVSQLKVLQSQGQLADGDGGAQLLLMAVCACALIFLGLIITAVFWMPLLMRGVGALASIVGPSARIASANIQKNHRRIASTGVALLIGVTLVSCLGTGAASAKETLNHALSTRYSVDLIAQSVSANGQDSGISHSQAERIAQVAGVEQTLYAPVAQGELRDIKDKQGNPVRVSLVGVKDAASLQKVMKVGLEGKEIHGDQALFPQQADGLELTTGDRADVDVYQRASQTSQPEPTSEAAPSGDQDQDKGHRPQTADAGVRCSFQVQQVDYSRASVQGSSIFVDRTLFDDGRLTADSHILLARMDPKASDTSLAESLQKVQEITSSSEGIVVSGPVAERMLWEQAINVMLGLLVGLLAVAVLIALIGVANTLSLSVIERTRESATLRAIGMTRGQLRRSLAGEALLIALVTSLVGVLVGTVFGWLGSYMVFSSLGSVAFPIDWGTDVMILLISVAAALLASVLPASRAVRTSPVQALAEA
ncbi:ABC transporter permease [Bifidobacterium aemilianum]|uniref:ABC transporter permease n=1 Tax=Bifidobacterium aemilianum TaxID=2493120 RepID=A0A366KBV2_9BIFI|nr:FtsX-like permease family protein [Bifidobacterium aemilianum]RBP98131.1 ABC transporter permease [Bifidobacterium aemilianum]